VSPERFSFARGARITRDILEREGVRGLWKGNSTVLARTLPYAAINFAMHDLVAGLLSEDGERLRVEQKFAAGAVAGMCSTTVTYPLDMVRARMAVAPRGSPSTVMSTMRGIYRRSGLRGLYAGLTPSLCGIIPYSGTTWMCFNSFKEALAIRKGQDPAHAHLSGLEHAVLGGVSAIIGQAVSYPLDTCRRRMQTARVAGGVTMSMVGVLRDIFAKEGFHGLYKGLTVNFVKAPIAHGISFASYHHIKQEMAARDWP
jgi:solute carrier family 25 protein 42